MRFTTAWAGTIAQNFNLRIAVAVLGTCSVFFSIATVRLALKEPLIIERKCVSRAITPADVKRSTGEIDAFVREALSRRFDAKAADVSLYLSAAELAGRQREQDELSRKGVNQKIIVNGTTIEGDTVTVDADRILVIGKVRSILPFPLTLSLSSRERTRANPYGLTLQKVTPLKVEESQP